MTEEEKLRIKSEVLIEFEDAKAELTLLQIKAANWNVYHQQVSLLLNVSNGDATGNFTSRGEIRATLERNSARVSASMDLNAVLALDSALEAAAQRLARAQAAKRDLHFS
jgi:hypothetical protein